jgi:hypothetical protein
MAEVAISSSGNEPPVISGRGRRDLIEVAVAYGLILLVLWTPRPLQRYLWMVAVATVAAMVYFSFNGLKAMGLRRENLLRSLWVTGVALAVSAAAVAISLHLHALRLPQPPAAGPGRWGGVSDGSVAFVKTYWGYALWSFVQQFLIQCFFLARLARLLPSGRAAALVTAAIFALAHLPNPILTPLTLLWGLAACLLFLHYRNLYPLAMAHAILGITVAIAIPGPVVRNMRVGLGYLTYGHAHDGRAQKPVSLPRL